jgi:uncharacterized membrane protein YqjE
MNWQNDRTMPEIVQNIVGNVQEIIRSEVRLAKTEIKEEGLKAGKAATFLIIGGVLSLYAVGFILLTLVYALASVVAAWTAALIVAVGVAVVAGIFLSTGTKRLSHVNPKPQKAIESMKENVQWAKNHSK